MHKAFCWTRLIYSLTPSSKAEHAYNVPCSPGLRINAAACPRPICTCSLKQSGALNDMLPCCKDYDLQDKVEQWRVLYMNEDMRKFLGVKDIA
eukprot:scaffold172231_cov26-Tisochrysis_lutea.AAC.1